MNIESKVLEYINGKYRQSMYEFVEEVAEESYERGYEDGRASVYEEAYNSRDFTEEDKDEE